MAECRNKKDKVRVYSSWQANNPFSESNLVRIARDSCLNNPFYDAHHYKSGVLSINQSELAKCRWILA